MIVVTFLIVKDDLILSMPANTPSAILWSSQHLRNSVTWVSKNYKTKKIHKKWMVSMVIVFGALQLEPLYSTCTCSLQIREAMALKQSSAFAVYKQLKEVDLKEPEDAAQVVDEVSVSMSRKRKRGQPSKKKKKQKLVDNPGAGEVRTSDILLYSCLFFCLGCSKIKEKG